MEKISQSFIKSMRKYLAGEECGHITNHQWNKGKLIELDSEAVNLGAMFEFYLTGALPKSGKLPLQNAYMASAIKKNGGKVEGLGIDDLYAKFRLAYSNADRIKKYLANMGLVIKPGKAGVEMSVGRFRGTIDIVAEVVEVKEGFIWNIGDLIVIDTKYSGLLDDRWSEHGWQWSDIQKKYHGTQAIQYNIVSGLPFYFLVCSSTNEEDVGFFHVPVDDHMRETHKSEALWLAKQLEVQTALGLTPRPEIAKCNKCPLRENCPDKHTYPHVKEVDLTLAV